MANEVYEARIEVTRAVNGLLTAARELDAKTIESLRVDVNTLYKEKEALLACKASPPPPPQTAEQLAEALMRAVFAPGAPTPHGGKKPTSFGVFNPVNRHVVEVHVKEQAPIATDPANHGKTWTRADEYKLVRLYRWGLTLSELARVFERYEDAIVTRLHLLNHARKPHPYGVIPENPSEKWYAEARARFFNAGVRTNKSNGLLSGLKEGWFYGDLCECGDQPVRPL